MASTTFDINDLRAEAQRGLHAGVGAVDLAIEALRTAFDDTQKRFEERIATAQKDVQQRFSTVQKSVKDFDLEPKALREQATTVVAARVEELTKEARARREAVEKRVAELQAEAQKFVNDNVETYTELAKRGEIVVNRLRKETSSNVDPGNVSKTTGERVTAKKTTGPAPAKKSTSRPATAKKAPAKKTATKKAPAKKAASS
jgi:hypothetical protein